MKKYWVEIIIEDLGGIVFVLSVILTSVILPSSETLIVLITFEQWVLELWYFTWIFLVIRLFREYHYFLPVTLTLEFDPFILKTLILLITFEQWVLELWYFTWVFLVMRPFSGYFYFWPCDLDLWVWPIFWKL